MTSFLLWSNARLWHRGNWQSLQKGFLTNKALDEYSPFYLSDRGEKQRVVMVLLVSAMKNCSFVVQLRLFDPHYHQGEKLVDIFNALTSKHT
mmetsp:Transcript_69730/g.109083  ORF Transcript_69730/g.109083 Transcript_69730/m.109083 type:complete len:92 (-) Transcript_69730:1207-1482(-)